ncbi:MAG: helix-turn-helix transcriptional regulator [Alphaproteobacteria bacterium]|nr:helix-turn-helix transcriptional regulator [Alphaproteobacteria bacterium]
MDQIKIGKYIAEKRKQANLTQEELGLKLGVGAKAVSKWERGRSLPDVSAFPELCKTLGISINELFAGENLEKEKIVPQSEKNILGVISYEIKKNKKWKYVIAGLIIIVVALIGNIVWKKYENGDFMKNYIEGNFIESKEKEILGALNSECIETASYVISDKCKKIIIGEYILKKGKIVSRNPNVLCNYIYKDDLEDNKCKGMIGLSYDIDSGKIVLGLSTSGTVSGTKGNIKNKVGKKLGDDIGVFGPNTYSEKTEIYKNKPIEIMNVSIDSDGCGNNGKTGENLKDPSILKDTDYTIVYTMTYK